MDRSLCPDVERMAGKLSGRWIAKGTRILVDDVIDNADYHAPEEIATVLFRPRHRQGPRLPERVKYPFGTLGYNAEAASAYWATPQGESDHCAEGRL